MLEGRAGFIVGVLSYFATLVRSGAITLFVIASWLMIGLSGLFVLIVTIAGLGFEHSVGLKEFNFPWGYSFGFSILFGLFLGYFFEVVIAAPLLRWVRFLCFGSVLFLLTDAWIAIAYVPTNTASTTAQPAPIRNSKTKPTDATSLSLYNSKEGISPQSPARLGFDPISRVFDQVLGDINRTDVPVVTSSTRGFSSQSASKESQKTPDWVSESADFVHSLIAPQAKYRMTLLTVSFFVLLLLWLWLFIRPRNEPVSQPITQIRSAADQFLCPDGDDTVFHGPRKRSFYGERGTCTEYMNRLNNGEVA